LTVATAALFAVNGYGFAAEGAAALGEFAAALAATVVATAACKAAFVFLGRSVSTKAALAKPRNLRKFADQGWQLAIHIFMTAYEWHLLAAMDWKWWTDTSTTWDHLRPAGAVPAEACPTDLRRLYIMQAGVWFVTAFMHKFVEAKHKDYFVMYGHHVATIGLVTMSYYKNWQPIGLLVLFVHDSSDIPVDTLKMWNYLGYDGTSGFYFAEIAFVVNLVTWAILRLWVFPTKVIYSTFFEYPHTFFFFERACQGLLCVLQCMHVWWYLLLLRILYRLLAGQAGHEAGGAEYEGSSDSEREGEGKKGD